MKSLRALSATSITSAFAGLALALVAGLVFAADRAKAAADLQDGIKNRESAKIQRACEELVAAGGKESLEVILKAAGSVDDRNMYYQLTGAAASFEGGAELEELGAFIVSHQNDKGGGSLARDLVFRLQNNPSSNVALPLGKILKEGKYDLQLVAVDQLAKSRTAESVDALVEGLKREDKGDPQLRGRIVAALCAICGADKGDVANWEGWWKEQRPKGVPDPSAAGAQGGTSSMPRDYEKTTTIDRGKNKQVIVLAASSPESKPEPNDFDYDHVEEILQKHKYPHKVMKRADFEKNPEKFLRDCYALLINCHFIIPFCKCPDCRGDNGTMTSRRFALCNPKCQKHEWECYGLKKKTLEKIKTWVEEGGYLYTEDWGLCETINVLWPDKVAYLGQKEMHTGYGQEVFNGGTVRQIIAPPDKYQPKFLVRLSPTRGNTTHPLMRGVWDLPPKKEPAKPEPGAEGSGKTGTRQEPIAEPLMKRWEVEDDSPYIGIKDPEHVVTLLESEDLEGLTNGNIAVAVTFRFGEQKERKVTVTGNGGQSRATGEWSLASKGGRVLHTLSHYGHQGNYDDGSALDNILLNFLIEAVKHHEANKEEKK